VSVTEAFASTLVSIIIALSIQPVRTARAIFLLCCPHFLKRASLPAIIVIVRKSKWMASLIRSAAIAVTSRKARLK
jgi:hypothetical protein